MNAAAGSVRIFEVSPRDGLQNEPGPLSTDAKVSLVEDLVAAGLHDIEVTSFVRSARIPQLADAAELAARLPRADAVRFWALVPNRRGLERALDAGIACVATVMSASETHNSKNLNRTARESLSGLLEVIAIARDEGLDVRAYVSTAFGCPYEGEVDPQRVVDLSLALLGAGAGIVALGDTTGVAHPLQVEALVGRLVRAGVPVDRIALHMHDTRGAALANIYAGYTAGVRAFDGAVAGVGGCPYAPGASGNAATEDIVAMFEAMGVSTGVDLDCLVEAGMGLASALGRELPGRFHRMSIGACGWRRSRSA